MKDECWYVFKHYQLSNFQLSITLLYSLFNSKLQFMDTNENLLSNDLQIDPISQSHLRETSRWAKFISIVGIVASILLVITAFYVGAAISRYDSYPYRRGYNSGIASLGGGLVTGLYLVIAVITFFVSLYLNRFATKMRTALDTYDQAALTASFQNIKIYFKIIGIILIIYITLMILGILISIGGR